MGLESDEVDPVDAAERLAGVEDPRGVEIRCPVRVDVEPDLDLADELHQVDHRLAQPVTVADERVRGERR